MKKNQNIIVDPIIQRAIDYLNKGEIISFPTETVYGLGADATNDLAVKKVFTSKNRPTDHPLIVHIACEQQLTQIAINIPEQAKLLAQHFWPGPLTIILEKNPTFSDLVTAQQKSVAIRIPRHPLTLELLRQFNKPIVGPSANTFGKLSPTTAKHVEQDKSLGVKCILDGGPCEIGIESTIISLLTPNNPVILRPGMISANQLSNVLGVDLEYKFKADLKNTQVSGQLESHYQPLKKCYIIEKSQINSAIDKLIEQHIKPVVINFVDDPDYYAHQIYALMHNADNDPQYNCIIIEKLPDTNAWLAINNRLQKASSTFLSLS